MAITLSVLWKQVSTNTNMRIHQIFTLRRLHIIREGLDAFRVERGRIPSSFEEFSNKCPPGEHWILNEDGVPVDSWDHPLIYIPDEEHPRILSYGEDGKSGGEGFSRDLSSDDDRRELPPFSFIDFLQSRLARPTFEICLKAEVLLSSHFFDHGKTKGVLFGLQTTMASDDCNHRIHRLRCHDHCHRPTFGSLRWDVFGCQTE